MVAALAAPSVASAAPTLAPGCPDPLLDCAPPAGTGGVTPTVSAS